MKRLFLVSAIISLVVTMASISWGATNLNSSRSNIYRVIYATDGMTSTQGAALVAELDKTPPVNEAALFAKEAITEPPSVPPPSAPSAPVPAAEPTTKPETKIDK